MRRKILWQMNFYGRRIFILVSVYRIYGKLGQDSKNRIPPHSSNNPIYINISSMGACSAVLCFELSFGRLKQWHVFMIRPNQNIIL